jgi:hypothetical protein
MASAIIGRLSLEKGVRVMVRGKLGYPYIYSTESGDQGVIQNLTYDVSVERIWDDEPKTGDKPEAKKETPEFIKRAKAQAAVEDAATDEDDIPF